MNWNNEEKKQFEVAFEDMQAIEPSIHEMVAQFNAQNPHRIVATFNLQQFYWGTLWGIIPGKKAHQGSLKVSYTKVPEGYIPKETDVIKPGKSMAGFNPDRDDPDAKYVLILRFSADAYTALNELAAKIGNTFDLRAMRGDDYGFEPYFNIKPNFPKYGLAIRRFR